MRRLSKWWSELPPAVDFGLACAAILLGFVGLALGWFRDFASWIDR